MSMTVSGGEFTVYVGHCPVCTETTDVCDTRESAIAALNNHFSSLHSEPGVATLKFAMTSGVVQP